MTIIRTWCLLRPPAVWVVVLLVLILCCNTEACSPIPNVKLGVFVREVRPLKGDSNKVLATLHYYACGQENPWQPSIIKHAILDLAASGRVHDVVDANRVDDLVLPPPTSLKEPEGSYSLTVNGYVGTDLSPTATLMRLNNNPDNYTMSTTIRLDVRPDGTELGDIEDWRRERLDQQVWHFYSPALGLVYIFYEIDYDAVTVTTINATNFTDTTTKTFYADGLPYAMPYGQQPDDEMVYDNVQILVLPGQGADCIYRIFAHYNSTSVILMATSQEGNYINVINSTREETFYKLQSNRVLNDPNIDCSMDDANQWGTVSMKETLIEEYLVSDPRTLLRQVTVQAKDLEDLFSSSPSSSPPPTPSAPAPSALPPTTTTTPSATPPPPPTTSAVLSICFSGETTVHVQKQQQQPQQAAVVQVPLKNLKVGDQVLTGNPSVPFQPVYMFAHMDKSTVTRYRQIFTTTSATAWKRNNNDTDIDTDNVTAMMEDDLASPLEISDNHLVYVVGKTHPVRASSLQVGDQLQILNDNASAVVTHIHSIVQHGLYAPLTADGTIVVTNHMIVASTYVAIVQHHLSSLALSSDGNDDKETTDMILPYVHQADLVHVWLSPVRLLCLGGMGIGYHHINTLCNHQNDQGFHFFVSFGLKLAHWIDTQQYPSYGKMLLWIVSLGITAPFRLLEMALGLAYWNDAAESVRPVSAFALVTATFWMGIWSLTRNKKTRQVHLRRHC